MTLDYKEIGQRIAHRRRQLGMKQSEVEEKADLSYKYLSNIERGVSIPSTETIMRNFDQQKLSLAKNFLLWLSEQDI